METHISIRVLWPFLRAVRSSMDDGFFLSPSTISPAALADPNVRLPRKQFLRLLKTALDKTGDPAIGLHAAERLEPGDCGVIEYLARNCATLREAVECAARNIGLICETAEVDLVESGKAATFRCRIKDGFTWPAAVNEFIVASCLATGRRYIGVQAPPFEIHFIHREATNIEEYRRVFKAPLKFNAAYNAIVFDKRMLELPVLGASPELRAAFELRAREALCGAAGEEPIGSLMHAEVAKQLRSGRASMELAAQTMHMSVATLRRRLKQEGTTFSRIIDEVRRNLACEYLRNPEPAFGEVAFLLGFSHISTFYRAFKRWTGTSPAQFRKRGGD
jgi:AraC-like DNA-binding protein